MPSGIRQWLLLVVYTATIFVSASLLFVVQPMVGKMILPHLGGSSSVWTTCMLFFQAMLVVGYVYAHAIAQRISPTKQVGVHAALVVLALVTSLPFRNPGELVTSTSNPALWLLIALLLSVGLPLFVVSSSAPLFQHWFSFTEHRDAEDPYYLYAASNVGSMLALFGYPFLVERIFTVPHQTELWAWGFGGLAVLTFACGGLLVTTDREDDPREQAPPERNVDPLSWKRRGWWLLITFIPSSLMLGVTRYMTTDLASVPLLWVLPLGLYLLSFIIVFARLRLPLWVLRSSLPIVTLFVLALTFAEGIDPAILEVWWIRGTLPASVYAILETGLAQTSDMWFQIIAHLGMFFMFALYFHGELARDRPETAHLTEFYIWMSVGGALGGLFNAVMAPILFDWMLEYYLVLALGLSAIYPLHSDPEWDSTMTRVGAAIGLAAALGAFLWPMTGVTSGSSSIVFGMAVVGVAVIGMSLLFPVGQNPALGVLLLLGVFLNQQISTVEVYERSFFANYTVYGSTVGGYDARVFSHGTTQHGVQILKDRYRFAPVGYYHPSGPLGDIFGTIPIDRVAVAGLGTGGMAPYVKNAEEMVFYEIDPVVEDIARKHFTYLERCGDRCKVKIGDARNLIGEEPERSFDIVMMDAYSSDSVPTHLLTTEAMKLYMSRVDEDGVVLCHVSNRYLDVEGVVGAVADELGYTALTRNFSASTRGSEALAYSSKFTVLAREPEDLGLLRENPDWREAKRADVVWTDQYTNLVSVIRW